jgi:hypothetical protein
MILTNTFAKARNANYKGELKRTVTVTSVPTEVAAACIAQGMSETLVMGEKTMWIDAATLDYLDRAIDQRPFARVGEVCDVNKVVGPHGIYGEDAPGRYVGSSGIYRVAGGALVTFDYM